MGFSLNQVVAQEAAILQDSTLNLQFVPGDYAVIVDIVVEGNRKTRRNILLREMSLRVGDTLWLDQLDEVVTRQRRLLLNTNLYSDAEVLISTLDLSTHETILRAVVREKWYFYPSVNLDLADRNFTVWWEEQNRALNRVNYGITLRHANVTGRADRISLQFQGGYTRKAEIKYEIPYINRAQTLGIEFGVLADRNREWWIQTTDGILEFLDLDSLNILRRQRIRIAATYRPGILSTHNLRLERQDNRIDKILALEENPNFFGASQDRQKFFGLRYSFIYDKRDERPFPVDGYLIQLDADKNGLFPEDNINRLFVSANIKFYKPINPKFSFVLDGKITRDLIRTRSPYFNRLSLGFNDDLVRGYQLYVVDGLDIGYLQSTFRYRLISKDIRLPLSPIQALKRVPFKLYVGVHGDIGGSNDPFNSPGNILANRLITSTGVGVYGVFFYGKVARFELTRNDLGEVGGYFSYSLGF